MCRYYKHIHACQHVRFVFAAHCSNGTFTQKPCGTRQVWQTLPIEDQCMACASGMITVVPWSPSNSANNSDEEGSDSGCDSN
ncbi:hypothetical protein BJ508DRAFT_332494 [Ascobolus immersus RN42]|uniref:Uncharacterized protein n=1 Tax=Ascobolus immersus RN42 TaxID=1160509 RepID=A0A3N4HPY7_ASCIM|nr:hypothetical protein BJ508DRAFT_332494 [Ascobolus immersus RN42]